MFIRKKCCVQNKRVRRNFKIKKIDFLRKREFWAVLNTRTLSNFRGRKVTIKLEKTNEGDVKQRRENPLSSSSSPPPPRGHEYVSVIVLHRRCSCRPLSDNATPLLNGTRVKFHFARHIHVTKQRGFLIAVPSRSQVLCDEGSKKNVCVKESYIYRGVYPFSMGEENKSVEK